MKSTQSRFLEIFKKNPSRTPTVMVQHSLNNPLHACAITGHVLVDIEGPLLYNHLPELLKKFSKHISQRVLQLHPLLIDIVPYLYELLYSHLLDASPYHEHTRYEMFNRLAIGPQIKHYTSASCCPPSPSPISVIFSDLWEIQSFTPYPIILTCEVDITLETFPIADRDKYRDRSYSPLPIPSSKSIGLIKELQEQISPPSTSTQSPTKTIGQ